MIKFDVFVEIHKIYEGVADTFLQKKHYFDSEFSDFEDEYKKMKSMEDKEVIVYDKKYYGNRFVIIKNPKSLENVDAWSRGIIDINGNLYVDQLNTHIHSNMIQVLSELNIINFTDNWHKEIPSTFVTVQRYYDTNTFHVGESNILYYENELRNYSIPQDLDIKQYKETFQLFLKKAKEKNPQYNFENKIITEVESEEIKEGTQIEDVDEIEDVKVKIENSDQEFTSKLIDKFTFVVMKRMVVKNLRPKKINGYLRNEEESGYKKNEMRKRSTLCVVMNNKDIIIGTYAGENVAITINDEIVYDVDRKEFDDNKFVDKLSEEYVKYLKNKGYNIKYGQN